MKRGTFICIFLLASFTACKKNKAEEAAKQLYPLAAGNKWIYIDSFFNETGFFYGLDTFTLKTVTPVNFEGRTFTPITDQYDDSIFTVHCTDSAVYLLKRPAALLIYKTSLSEAVPEVVTQYNSGLYTVTIQTKKITSTSHPSYKIIIAKDDGVQSHYRQQELYFAPGTGIIKGRDYRYGRTGVLYAFDSYRLDAYSFY